MARPRVDDPVTNKPLGLPGDLWKRVEQAARHAGLSRSRWIRNAIEARLFTTATAGVAHTSGTVVRTCPHERRMLTVTPYGITRCDPDKGGCDKVIR